MNYQHTRQQLLLRRWAWKQETAATTTAATDFAVTDSVDRPALLVMDKIYPPYITTTHIQESFDRKTLLLLQYYNDDFLGTRC